MKILRTLLKSVALALPILAMVSCNGDEPSNTTSSGTSVKFLKEWPDPNDYYKENYNDEKYYLDKLLGTSWQMISSNGKFNYERYSNKWSRNIITFGKYRFLGGRDFNEPSYGATSYLDYELYIDGTGWPGGWGIHNGKLYKQSPTRCNHNLGNLSPDDMGIWSAWYEAVLLYEKDITIEFSNSGSTMTLRHGSDYCVLEKKSYYPYGGDTYYGEAWGYSSGVPGFTNSSSNKSAIAKIESDGYEYNSDGSVTVSFRITNKSACGHIYAAQIEYETRKGTSPQTATIKNDIVSATFSGLLPDTEYYFHCYIKTAAGVGESKTYTITT